MFIIVGVWLEENRLSVYNGDLAGRLISVNADLWSFADLTKVIEDGTSLLNVQFNNDLIDTIITESFYNVCFVQEICYRICKSFGIKRSVPIDIKNEISFIDENGDYENRNNRYFVPQIFDVRDIIQKIVRDHSGRYKSFMLHFADETCDNGHEIYKWILLPVIIANSENLETGLSLLNIVNTIYENHPIKENLSSSKIIKALKRCSEVQLKKNIRPNILDYDETEDKLNVVDKGFIIWMEHQHKKDLLNLIELPPE